MKKGIFVSLLIGVAVIFTVAAKPYLSDNIETTASLSTFTPVEGQIVVDKNKDTLVVGDGSTAGGIPLARQDLSTSLLTASKAAVTNSSGVLTTGTTTAAEIGYLNGVTSAIQPQIDGYASTISNKEDASNKVTTISSESTDTQYPSAKLVYDQLAGKQVSGTYSTDIHSNITALNAVSGTNTGDNATNSQYSGLAASKLDLHATADTALKADQLTTTRTIFGQNFNGSANVTGAVTATNLNAQTDGTSGITLGKNNGTAVVTIDTTNSRQGVNKSVPETQFHVMSTETGNTRGVTIDNYASSAATIWRRANGTPASPTQVLTGEPLGFFAFRGLDNAGTGVFPSTSSVYMQAMASENYTTTARGGYLQIATTPTGTTTSAVAMNIMGNGNISIGTSITPTARLHLPAGTAAAGTASLLIAPGTLTTTPVSGQIENNNQLYFTDSAAERRAIASSLDTSITADTTKTVEGYITLNIAGTNYKVMVTN